MEDALRKESLGDDSTRRSGSLSALLTYYLSPHRIFWSTTNVNHHDGLCGV